MSQLILVVEDDMKILNLLLSALKINDFNVISATNGKEALQLMTLKQPALVMLDLGLPDIDGIEVLKQFRTWSEAHLIVISARSSEQDKVKALDEGADNYLTKPFSIEELLARVRVGLRRTTKQEEQPIYQNGNLMIDYQSQIVTMNNQEIHLTPIEYKLLVVLSKHEDQVLSHNYLLKEVWGHAIEEDLPSLRVFMATLRKKIEPNIAEPIYIQTHVGVGYRLKHYIK